MPLSVPGPLRAAALCAALLPAVAAAADSVAPVDALRGRVILADEATLASDKAGILAVVGPTEGDRVKAGELIARLKDEVAAAALAVAEKTATNDVEIRYSIAAAEVAAATYRRAVEANRLTPGVVPEVQSEELRLAAERAKLQIEKAKLDFEVAKLERDRAAAELKSLRIVAPFAGVVTRVLKHQGEAVSQGDPILRVVSTDTLRVEGEVTPADALRLKPGDPVTVRIGSDVVGLSPEDRDRTFEGRLGFIDEEVNRVTQNFRVWASIKNQNGLLKAGLPAVMRIRPGPRDAAPAALPAAGAKP